MKDKYLNLAGKMEGKMLDSFEFETFIDIHSNTFMAYVSSIVAKLTGSDSAYQGIHKEISKIYDQYPKVAQLFDVEKATDLSEQDCEALIKILLLRNQLTDLEMQAVYLRGCCDCVGYLKKAGIL